MIARVSGCVAALLLGSVTVASAGTLTLTNNTAQRRSGAWGNGTFNAGSVNLHGGGGAFQAYAQNIAGVEDGSFLTFCVELNEFTNFGTAFNAVVNPLGAVSGGNSGGNPDGLSNATRWLYWNFATNQSALAGATGADWTDVAAVQDRNAAIQLAIWMLEGELDLGSVTGAQLNSSTFADRVDIADLANSLASAAMSASPVVGQGRVQVLNMTDQHGTRKQDMLSIVVPLPTAGGMCFAGLLTVLAVRRRVRV